MLFEPENFGSFSPLRMAHPPSKATELEVIFMRVDNCID